MKTNKFPSDIKDYLSYNPLTGNIRWIKKASRNTIIGSIAGTKNIDGRTAIVIHSVRLMSHRIGFFLYHGWCPDILDHINRIKSDNRIENLRPATNSQNGMNKGIIETNTSGVIGVHWDKVNKKWYAKIGINKKYYNLGRYIKIEDAVKARQKAELKYFGEFSINHTLTNPPDISSL